MNKREINLTAMNANSNTTSLDSHTRDLGCEGGPGQNHAGLELDLLSSQMVKQFISSQQIPLSLNTCPPLVPST